MKKGDYGYIDWRKKRALIKSILIYVIGFFVYFLGLFLNNGSKQNIFTVASVLIFLPASRTLVSYIVLYKYKTDDKSKYKILKNVVSDKGKLYSDLVISSTKKTMCIHFLVISGLNIYGFTNKANKTDSTDYLNQIIKDYKYDFKLHIYDDFSKLINAIGNDTNSFSEDIKFEEFDLLIKSLVI